MVSTMYRAACASAKPGAGWRSRRTSIPSRWRAEKRFAISRSGAYLDRSVRPRRTFLARRAKPMRTSTPVRVAASATASSPVARRAPGFSIRTCLAAAAVSRARRPLAAAGSARSLSRLPASVPILSPRVKPREAPVIRAVRSSWCAVPAALPGAAWKSEKSGTELSFQWAARASPRAGQ